MSKNNNEADWGEDRKRGRRQARDQMRDWVGDLDRERLNEIEDADELDQYVVFERIRQKKKPYFEE